MSKVPSFACEPNSAFFCWSRPGELDRFHLFLPTGVTDKQSSSSVQCCVWVCWELVTPEDSFSLAQFEGGRSAEEIQKFWQSSEHPSINKQEWSVEEVEQLRAIAAAHGHLEWHLVAEELGVRSKTLEVGT